MDVVDALTALGGFASRQALLREGMTRRAIASADRKGLVLRISRGIYGFGLPDGSSALHAAAAVLRGVAVA